MKKSIIATALATSLAALSISTASAADLTLTLTNLTHGNTYTPLFFSAHAAGQHIFEVNTAASASIQAMAEGGSISALIADQTALNADNAVDPNLNNTLPGASASFDLVTQQGNTHLSMVAMILPTNDGFVGLDALEIPEEEGTYTYYLNGYDAGTEVNDEIINGGGMPGMPGIPGDPTGENGTNGTGVTNTENNAKVHIHRGIIGDTDKNAGISDLDSRIHRWLNPVARLVIEVK